jgi:hypothetical protein
MKTGSMSSMLAGAAIVVLSASPVFAAGDGIAILRQGLLGAGTGAAATAMTGSKGGEVWKGALIGMGVNVVGGALLDVITTPGGTRTVVYARPEMPAAVRRPEAPRQYSRYEARQAARRRIYGAGYSNGYRRGYAEGYDDALIDMGY